MLYHWGMLSALYVIVQCLCICSQGIVIISDGVFGLPNAAMVHALLAQLRSHTVCCSFVKVGSLFQAQCRYMKFNKHLVILEISFTTIFILEVLKPFLLCFTNFYLFLKF